MVFNVGGNRSQCSRSIFGLTRLTTQKGNEGSGAHDMANNAWFTRGSINMDNDFLFQRCKRLLLLAA
jgi:hypothetical protein